MATAGCLGSALPESDDPPAFPLEAPRWQKDMVWKYRVGHLDPAGGAVWHGVVEYQVIGPPQCDIVGVCIFELSVMHPDGRAEPVVVKSTDLHRIEGPIPVEALPFPLHENATQMANGFQYHVGWLERVEVPAGRLWAVEVTAREPAVEYHDWYAPSVRWSARTVLVRNTDDGYETRITELVGFMADVDDAPVGPYQAQAVSMLDEVLADVRILRDAAAAGPPAGDDAAPDAAIDRARADLGRLQVAFGGLFEPKVMRGAQALALAGIQAAQDAAPLVEECVSSGTGCAQAQSAVAGADLMVRDARVMIDARP